MKTWISDSWWYGLRSMPHFVHCCLILSHSGEGLASQNPRNLSLLGSRPPRLYKAVVFKLGWASELPGRLSHRFLGPTRGFLIQEAREAPNLHR